MGDTKLKELADDLSKFLVDIKPKPVERPSITEERDVRQVSRALFEYVLHRAHEHALAEDIGLGLAIGASTASTELNLKTEEILEGIEGFVADAISTARETLKRKK